MSRFCERQLVDALTDEARERLYASVDAEAAAYRELGDELLPRVLEMQTLEAAARSSPLRFTPLIFEESNGRAGGGWVLRHAQAATCRACLFPNLA